MAALSMMRTDFRSGQGCMCSSSPAINRRNSSPQMAWLKIEAWIPSRHRAGRMEYLTRLALVYATVK